VANELTGDFDVVAEFSLPAVNRLLAAMHAVKRFPHSLALRVDDIPRPPDRVRPSVFEILDAVGDAVVDHGRVRAPDAHSASPAAGATFASSVSIVNTDARGVFVPPLVPSQLQGRVQMQLSPPTLEIADPAASRIRVRLGTRARYFADPGTPPAAEFARGDLVLTTSVSQITSQAGSVVDIDLRSNAVQAAFEPTWSSRPLSAEDRAGINLLIGNALRSSVLPSNTTLPSSIRAMKFKALTGASQAIAVLLSTTSAPGNPATVQRVFLGSNDFAFGVGAETIKAALQPALSEIISMPIAPVSIRIPLVVTSATATYTIELNSATIDLLTGQIKLTIRGRATAPQWFAPNFDFVATQALDLQPSGSTADLVIGEMTFDTDSWIVDRFRGRALERMAAVRDRALARSGVGADVRRMLDAERNLGGFLRSLLTPPRPDGQPQPLPHGSSLRYSSTEISPAGIVLRGSLAVDPLPPAHVEFEEIAESGGGPLTGTILPSGPEYSALKSWIAGGTIATFEWKRAGLTQPGFQDDKKFVLLPQGPVITDGGAVSGGGMAGPLVGFQAMCLTIRGTRLSPSGAVVPQPVTASYCAFDWFPLFDLALAGEREPPLVTLTQPGRRGEVEVVGHAPAVRGDRSKATPNRIVHFADAASAAKLEQLTEALRKSGRSDAATAIVAVLRPDDLAAARHVPGIVYAEEHDDAWERLWGIAVGRRPATFVIAATGKAAWEHHGELDTATLADALRRVLVPIRLLKVRTVTTGVRIGQAPPNFLFEHAAGHQLTLRKLVGRPVLVVFWRSAARASVDAVRALVAARPPAWQDAVLVAIGDGEAGDGATKGVSFDSGATIVPDPTRSISRAYGVVAWPTVVLIDARGVVREVRHGGLAAEPAEVCPAPTGATAE
jgi:hypothetical protein